MKSEHTPPQRHRPTHKLQKDFTAVLIIASIMLITALILLALGVACELSSEEQKGAIWPTLIFVAALMLGILYVVIRAMADIEKGHCHTGRMINRIIKDFL